MKRHIWYWLVLGRIETNQGGKAESQTINSLPPSTLLLHPSASATSVPSMVKSEVAKNNT